jgi:hypothetical protein
VSARLDPFTATVISARKASMALCRDRVLACGPSTAWLDAEQWAPPPHRARIRASASITGFIEHG